MLRPAIATDLEPIARLHRASIDELCATHYDADQRAQWIAALRPELYAALLAACEVVVVVRDEALAGFGVLDATAARINATYVDPRAARSGVGRSLVAAMEAAAHDAPRLTLNATLNAAPFYERLGYARVGAARNRLPSGLELPCIVMAKTMSRPAPPARTP